MLNLRSYYEWGITQAAIGTLWGPNRIEFVRLAFCAKVCAARFERHSFRDQPLCFSVKVHVLSIICLLVQRAETYQKHFEGNSCDFTCDPKRYGDLDKR